MNFFQSVLNAGVLDSRPDRINLKIKLANSIALFFIGICIIFTMSYILMGDFNQVSSLLPALVVYSSIPYLNRISLHNLSRTICSIMPATICFFMHISFIKVGEEGITSLYMIQITCVVLPWVLFDFKEKGYLFFTFAICSLWIFLINPLNYLIEPPAGFDKSSMMTENQFMITTGTALFMLSGKLYLLQVFNRNAELKAEGIQVDTERKNEELKRSEEELQKYLQEVELAREEDKKREWANKGIALFSEIMRNNTDDGDNLYNKIISNMVKYLDANQGTIFVIDGQEEESFLVMKACYAYNRVKHMNQTVALGEGLVGQCYLEKDIINLTDIPQNYMKITSGIGEALPRNIIILPLLMNDVVYGVIELASFKIFETYQVEFLKKISETIASTIANNKINERTKILLEQSLKQSREIQEQEEVTRQNLEEMTAIQEEMDRKHTHLEKALEEAELKTKEYALELENARKEVEKYKVMVKG